MVEIKKLTLEELNEGIEHVKKSPKSKGLLEQIVCRPAVDLREILEKGNLDINEGLIGDNWKTRGSSRTTDKSSHPDMQLNMMNSRAVNLIAQNKERWQLAGDQLFVDMDLSEENMPPGTVLAIGLAIIQVTNQPHRGCIKFAERFGKDALKWVNSTLGVELHLRGVNAKVLQSGTIKVGDLVEKI